MASSLSLWVLFRFMFLKGSGQAPQKASLAATVRGFLGPLENSWKDQSVPQNLEGRSHRYLEKLLGNPRALLGSAERIDLLLYL